MEAKLQRENNKQEAASTSKGTFLQLCLPEQTLCSALTNSQLMHYHYQGKKGPVTRMLDMMEGWREGESTSG